MNPRSRISEDIEAVVREHPLVNTRLSPESMDLIRAHQMVEAGHRHDAYSMVVIMPRLVPNSRPCSPVSRRVSRSGMRTAMRSPRVRLGEPAM